MMLLQTFCFSRWKSISKSKIQHFGLDVNCNIASFMVMHCKDTVPKIRNKYSQKCNCAASLPISTFMFLWAIYIPTTGPPIFLQKIRGPTMGIYIILSQMHEWGNWERSRASSFLGIHKLDLLCGVSTDRHGLWCGGCAWCDGVMWQLVGWHWIIEWVACLWINLTRLS